MTSSIFTTALAAYNAIKDSTDKKSEIVIIVLLIADMALQYFVK